MTTIKDEVVLSVETDVKENSAIEKMEKLKKSILETKREQIDLNDAWKKGQLTADEYVKEQVRIDNSLKKLNSEYGKHQAQVTGVKSKLDQLLDKTKDFRGELKAQASTLADSVAPGLGSATTGMWGLVKSSLAFIATPIGLVLAAVGVALATIITFLKNSSAGMDAFEDASAAVGAIMDVLIDRIAKIGGALVKLFTGDPIGAFKDMKEAVSGVADEIKREAEEAIKLAAAIRDLEDNEIRYRIAASETENTIKQLILQSKNRRLSEEERIALLQKAIELEKEQNKVLVANETEGLRIASDTAAKRLNIKRKQAESEMDFAKRIVEATMAEGAPQIDDLRDKVIEHIEKVNKASGESINIQEKIINQQDALRDKAQARIDKEKELTEAAHEWTKAFMESLDADAKKFELERTQQAEREAMANKFREDLGLKVQKTMDASVMMTQIQKKQMDEDVKNKQNSVKIKKMLDDSSLANTANMLGQASTLFKENTMAYRVTATAQALINTYLGASKAAAEFGWPLGPIFAAVMVAQGLMTVAKINGVKLAQGGHVNKEGTFSGPSHAQGGIKYYGTDGRVIEVEGGENFYVLKKSASNKINRLSALNVAEGGNSFGVKTSFAALGGQIETTNATSGGIDGAQIQSAIAQGMQGIKIVTYVEDVRDGISKQVELEDRANVI